MRDYGYAHTSLGYPCGPSHRLIVGGDLAKGGILVAFHGALSVIILRFLSMRLVNGMDHWRVLSTRLANGFDHWSLL